MSTALTIMNRLKAESLLADSHILAQIESLKKGLQYKTDEAYVSFDDHFLFLQEKIDLIPRIMLKDNIKGGAAGNAYENELMAGLEEIQDQVEKWKIKTKRFQGDLVTAKSDITDIASSFGAWYFVAAVELLSTTDIKLPSQNIKALAVSEFTRLMDHSNLGIDALIEAVKIELERLDAKKKLAREKFDMGREQVNAAWANKLPESLGYSPDAPKHGVLQSGVIEDEDEYDVPAYISRNGEVKTPVNQASDQPWVDTFCGECSGRQFEAPNGSGVTCSNGHGGAPSFDTPPVAKVKEDGWAHSGEDDSIAGLSRELTGMLNHDRHEQVVEKIAEQIAQEKKVKVADGYNSAEEAEYELTVRAHFPVYPESGFNSPEEAEYEAGYIGSDPVPQVGIGVAKEIKPTGEVVVTLNPDVTPVLEQAVSEITLEELQAVITDADARAEKLIEELEIKGTFKKTGTAQPVNVIAGEWADDELNTAPAIDTPTERARLDFDDFDNESPVEVPAFLHIQILNATAPELDLPEPTPAPAKPASHTVPAFDFDDDDF